MVSLGYCTNANYRQAMRLLPKLYRYMGGWQLIWLFFVLSKGHGQIWFRIFGYGLMLKRSRSFSERIGYNKYLRIGKLYISVL